MSNFAVAGLTVDFGPAGRVCHAVAHGRVDLASVVPSHHQSSCWMFLYSEVPDSAPDQLSAESTRHLTAQGCVVRCKASFSAHLLCLPSMESGCPSRWTLQALLCYSLQQCCLQLRALTKDVYKGRSAQRYPVLPEHDKLGRGVLGSSSSMIHALCPAYGASSVTSLPKFHSATCCRP